METKKCNLCPRNCNADRNGELGFCGATNTIKIARASRHMWEEPCISGTNGSGTVFFSGCNLKCIYCQNELISQTFIGKELSIKELCELFIKISESGVHNINLVTPTHFMSSIIQAIKPIKTELKVPIVYNTSGYEKAELIKACEGIIDIFLTDIKYKSKELSAKYSLCDDYFDKSIIALEEMINIGGAPTLKNGIMQRGIIVRHLVLPSCKKDSIDILNTLYEKFGNNKFLVSLMNQFTPNKNCKSFPELNRLVTSIEYKRVAEAYERLGFKGYLQEKTSATDIYIPDFND